MARAKLSITIRQDLLTQVQELATSQSQPMSRVIEAALQQFLAAKMEAVMEEGYRVMAELDRNLPEADMAAGYEVLPSG